MPELPEVETMVRGIRPFVEGRVIRDVRLCPCDCRPLDITPTFSRLSKRLAGQRVSRVARRAKRVLLELQSGDVVAIEPRMTGLMLLSDPPDEGHLRVEWRFAGRSRYRSLFYWDRRGLGTIRLYSREEAERALGSTKLGPDALDMTAALWQAACARTARPIKLALLDQKLAAGIGNLYASEILHLARISPLLPADRLSKQQLARLDAATHDVLETAIRYEGSTLSDGTYRNAVSQAGRYQNEHRVYAREGEPCPTCRKSRIVRIVQAQRSTFYCATCQPHRPRARR